MTCYLSFDIAGTHIKYALMSASEEILEKNHVMSPKDLDDFWSAIDDIILTYHIKERIKENYDLPATVLNDGKAAALAKVWQGSLKGVSDGATIILGTGVGGGLVLNGKLRSGVHFQAGELSFILLNPANQSFDKMSGYLESAVGMIEKINQIIGNSDIKDGLIAFKAVQSKKQKQ